jgi:hypothetical protein
MIEQSVTSACLQVAREIMDLKWPVEPVDDGREPKSDAPVFDQSEGFAAICAIFEKVDPALRNRVFWALDEGPGLWHGFVNHHWKLRRTRNTPEAKLFDVLGRG